VVVKKKESTEEKTPKKVTKSHTSETKTRKKKALGALTPQAQPHNVEETKHAPHAPKEEKVHEAKTHEVKSVEHKTHTEHKTHAETKTETHTEKTHVPHVTQNVCPPEQTQKTILEKKAKEILQPEINIGMIGHVDHGKTSLTKALTGKWCDTHSEEVKRGISIRLGYADVVFYKLKTQNGTVYANKAEYNGKPAEIESKRVVSFVDAPGHETLMTTMLSGAALMNGAVLVIASNEVCPQPRTVEHLMALKFAGVDKVVVAQNKVDLITKEQAIENYKAIRKFLDDYGYKDAPIIPTAANFGVNIDSLIEAIETHIPTPNYNLEAPMKMFVARSFDINKPGTKAKDLKGAIIGGSITQGIVKVGDELEILPGLNGPTKTKVLSISTDQGLVQQARPGGLLAIGTDLDPSMAQNDRLRGQIAGKAGTLPKPVKEMVIKVFMFERMLEQNLKEKTQIKVTDPLVITIGTNTVVGFVIKTDTKTCTVNLKNEVVAEKGEKVALSKNIAGQWRLIAYGEVM
jgi:translation initiation factor 2 subunit 3